MIPLIIALVASTAISFVMVKFVFAPGLEKKIKAELSAGAEGGEGGGAAKAGEPAGDKKDAHGAPADKKEADKKDAHGAPAKDAHGASPEKGEKEKGAKQTKAGWEYSFPNVVSNLTGSLGTKYVKVSFTVLSDDKNIADLLEENKSKLKDAAIRVLGSRSLADMESSNAKNVLCSEIAANFNKALNANTVKQIFLTEFLIQ